MCYDISSIKLTALAYVFVVMEFVPTSQETAQWSLIADLLAGSCINTFDRMVRWRHH